MLKTVFKISMHDDENVLKLPNYDPSYQFLCIIALIKVKPDIINIGKT